MNEYWLITCNRSNSLPADTIQISEALAAYLDLSLDDIIPLFIGRKCLDVKIKLTRNKEHRKKISLPSAVYRQLYFRPGQSCGIRRDDEGIHLGPVIGIMADPRGGPSEAPFGGQSFFIRQCLTEGTKLGLICFAFSPFSIQYQKKYVQGYTYNNSAWHSGVFPIPDVIYPRESGYSPIKKRIRKRLEAMGCQFLNPPLIGKWQTYKILSQHSSLQRYIPQTMLLTSFQQVDGMINRYKAIYMKPVAGSQGRNIVRVIKRGPNLYLYQYQLNDQIIRGTARGIGDLQRSLRRVMGNKTYIVQERIPLLKNQGNIIDVRILVQKDENGVWQVTGKACRIGRSGSITSNISSGGRGRKVSQVLSVHFPEDKARTIMDELDQLGLMVASAMEKGHDPMGEMGIDIGIDIDGKLWFIETNLRPARQVFSLIGDQKTRLTSVRRPMLYSRYLAGFQQGKDWTE